MSYDFLNDNGDYEAGREAMKKRLSKLSPLYWRTGCMVVMQTVSLLNLKRN